MSHPVEIFGTQDLKDDDAAVIDSYLIETDAPPDMTPARQPIDNTAQRIPIVVTGRLVPCGEQVLTPTMDPVLIMPADDNRKHAYIRVYSPTAVATDGIRFGDSNNTVRNGARILHGAAPTIDDYTGAIYVWPQTVAGAVNSANINVEYWAVTV